MNMDILILFETVDETVYESQVVSSRIQCMIVGELHKRAALSFFVISNYPNMKMTR